MNTIKEFYDACKKQFPGREINITHRMWDCFGLESSLTTGVCFETMSREYSGATFQEAFDNAVKNENPIAPEVMVEIAKLRDKANRLERGELQEATA